MPIIIITIIASALLTFAFAFVSNRIWFSYLATLLTVHGIYFIQAAITGSPSDPFAQFANIILTLVIIGSSFLGHIIWILYCLNKGKNVTDIEDLK